MTHMAQSLPSPATVPSTLARRSTLIGVAAVGTLLLSRGPEIVLREGFGLSTPWLQPSLVAVAALVWIATRAVRGLAPLSSYFAVMTAVSAILAVVPVLFASETWASLAPASAGPIVVLLAERLVLGGIALAFVGAVLIIGGKGSGRYLRIRPTPSGHGGAVRSRVRWSLAGPAAIVALVALTTLAMAPFFPSSFDLAAAAPFLVMAVMAAALNSFWEEAVFRATPMAPLASAIGSGPAVLMLAVWFGLGHYYGGAPSGPIGAVMVTLVGLVLGRAMVDTRGLAWPWAIHFSIDLTIYTVMALAATAA